MNWFDALVVFFLVVQIVNNARKGLLRTLLEITSLFLSVFLAILAFQKCGQFIQMIFLKLPAFLAQILSFTVIWLGIYLGLLALGDLLTKFYQKTIFGKIDALLGAIFGFIKGSVMVILVIIFLIVLSYFSALPDFLESGYRQSFCFRSTSNYLAQGVSFANEWLLAEVPAAPSIFNQINMLMINKTTGPQELGKISPVLIKPLNDMQMLVKERTEKKLSAP